MGSEAPVALPRWLICEQFVSSMERVFAYLLITASEKVAGSWTLTVHCTLFQLKMWRESAHAQTGQHQRPELLPILGATIFEVHHQERSDLFAPMDHPLYCSTDRLAKTNTDYQKQKREV